MVHVDLHSGLGHFADYRLLLVQWASDPGCGWYRNAFGGDRVKPLDDTGTAGYAAAGAMGTWLRCRFNARDYRFVTAEFGTYSPLRVLAALRAENRAHFYNRSTDAAYDVAKRELLECFCPADTAWRDRVVSAALAIIDQAVECD